MTAFVMTALLSAGCSNSKSHSPAESGLSDYEIESVSPVDYNSKSGDLADGNFSSSEGSYSSDDSYSETPSYNVDSEVSSVDNENWDNFLKSYDEFADKYIALLKKVQKGDVSALANYIDYAEEAQAFVDKMNSASGVMSAAQITRFNRIQQKILRVLSSVKIDESKLNAMQNTIESVSSAMSSDDDTNISDDDDEDDDW